ncbi:MAG: RNA polymerase sigma factor [Balneolaceae bacterium]|nr:MAG: RNA polymerase sigma factor [Balneolaceae bacterium]
MDPTTDNVLMMKVKNGDIDRLGLLFERYHHRLFAFFYRLTARRDVSEDLVQGVFERILKYRHSFSDQGSFSSWLFGIARNLHIDYCNNSRPADIALDEAHLDIIAAESPDSPDHSDGNLSHLLVRRALEKLDPDKKQVLILSRYEGFKYREIAAIMNCSEAAVKVRVFRALNEMKETITAFRNQERL